MAAMAVLIAQSRGLLDFDEPWLRPSLLGATWGIRHAYLRVEFNSGYGIGRVRGVARAYGASPIGMHGGGGSAGSADPDVGIGFAYAPNQLSLVDMRLRGDPRMDALIDALCQVLADPPPRPD